MKLPMIDLRWISQMPLIDWYLRGGWLYTAGFVGLVVVGGCMVHSVGAIDELVHFWCSKYVGGREKMAKRIRVTFVVEGGGSCRAPRGARGLKRVELESDYSAAPTIGRWNSFGWKVLKEHREKIDR